MNNLRGAKRFLPFLCVCFFMCGVLEALPSPLISPLGLPDGAKMRIGRGRIESLAYSPDSRRLAVASSIGIWIYDALYGGEIALLRGHTEQVNSASYSPDGKRIVSASNDNTIRIWDAETGALLNTLKGHEHSVNSALYSLDGKRIVSAGNDKTIRIWDSATGEPIKTLKGHGSSVNSAALSPDGNRIVSASNDNTICIWDAATGDLLKTLEGHTEQIWSAALSPDGKRIASVSGDRTVRIWDSATGALLNTLDMGFNPFGIVRLAAYSPDGRYLMGGNGNMLRVWDAEHGSPLQPIFDRIRGPGADSFAFSPDGHSVAAASDSGPIYIWNIKLRARVRAFEGHTDFLPQAVALSPDGKRLVTVDRRSYAVYINDVETGARLKSYYVHSFVQSLGYSPDGKRLVIGYGHENRGEYGRGNRNRGMVLIWEAEKKLHTLEGHSRKVMSAAYSSDAKRIVTASQDKTIRVWNAENGALLHTLEGNALRINSAAYSPDGKRIASAGWGGKIRIWDAENGASLNILEGHPGEIYSVSYSPDGRRILSVGNGGVIWDAETGAQILTLKRYRSLMSAAYSPDGKTIVSGGMDRIVRLWDAETGTLLKKLKGHTGYIGWAAFLQDGKTLASSGIDGTVLLWDISDL